MKVAMDAPERARDYSPNIAKDTTAYKTSDSHRTGERNGIALDISGTVMDNTAYGGHGKTTEDVMQAAGNEDIVTRRNYMAIMSNTMSEEDFAKLQEEGVHPGDEEIETVVTIVDHIKAALVQGGTEVAGYTDDLDAAQFEQITGNQVLAQELSGQFQEKDLPATDDNIKAAAKAWEKAQEITELSEGAEKFLIENKLPPTIENLYLAQFSGGTDAGRQGKGYYAQDLNVGHSKYYAKKAEDYNWGALEAQMEKVIRDAGYESNAETLKDSKWLIEKGIPLTPENFTALRELRELHLPQSEAEIAKAIAASIADGKDPLTANMLDSRSNLEKAVVYVNQVAEIEPQAVDTVLSEKQIVTIKNLWEAQEKYFSDDKRTESNQNRSSVTNDELSDKNHQFLQENSSEEAVTARRQLEEIRLKMTVEVNIRLLRSGFQIDTASLEQLVNQLKEAEKAIQMQLTGSQDAEEAALRFSLYQETVTKVNEISAMPADLLGRMAIIDIGAMEETEDLSTLNRIHESGTILQSTYEKAGETYESVMTAPRRDMGDSIRKAFRNVDTILEDMNLEINENNRRAIRILGYNNMELTDENIAAVKEKDSLLQDVISQCRPGTILEMIREKVNPLNMSLEELQSYLSGKSGNADHTGGAVTAAGEMEDYSRFLYKLERKNGITEQERGAYIGVYRLLRQIEKGDSAVVGAMLNAEMEFSMGNLLTAVRSSKKQGMEVLVNDDYGGVSAKSSTEDLKQIMSEILDSLESEEVEEEYHREEVKEVQTLKNTEDAVIRSLLDHNQPVTWNNLMAAGSMMKHPGLLFRKASERAKEAGKEVELQEEIENLYENFTDEASAQNAYRQLQETVTDIFKSAADLSEVKAIDVRELGGMCRQITLAASFVREEQYEIPVEIDGEITAINLRIVHNNSEDGKVTAALQTGATGQAACEFKISGGILTGYVTCQEKGGLDKLKQSEDLLKDMLNSNIDRMDIQIGNISFIQSGKSDLNALAQERLSSSDTETDSEKQTLQVSAKELYMAAKAFIGYIQQAI